MHTAERTPGSTLIISPTPVARFAHLYLPEMCVRCIDTNAPGETTRGIHQKQGSRAAVAGRTVTLSSLKWLFSFFFELAAEPEKRITEYSHGWTVRGSNQSLSGEHRDVASADNWVLTCVEPGGMATLPTVKSGVAFMPFRGKGNSWDVQSHRGGDLKLEWNILTEQRYKLWFPRQIHKITLILAQEKAHRGSSQEGHWGTKIRCSHLKQRVRAKIMLIRCYLKIGKTLIKHDCFA